MNDSVFVSHIIFVVFVDGPF